MIESKDVSVVMQGPVYGSCHASENEQITKKCCEQVKKLMPDCELILSTWEGTDVEDIPVDKIVYNSDPGGVDMVLNGIKRLNNTNRMIVSTFNGVKAASKKYVLKIRTDIFIERLSFLKLFDAFPIDDKNAILKARIISLSANHPKRGANIVFSVSDWVEFGYREDIYKFWDIPLQDNGSILESNGQKDFSKNRVGESYIWPLFLQKDLRYTDMLQQYTGVIPPNDENINIYEKSLAEYVVLYEGKQLGINSLKYWNKNYVRHDFARASCYMHYEWKLLYKKFCNQKYRVHVDLKGAGSVILYILVFKFIQVKFNGLYKNIKIIYNKFRGK